jgi:hypothetical protein
MLYSLLQAQKLGITKPVCEMFGHFLDNARFHVKTSLGVLAKYFCHTSKRPKQGPGQGSKQSQSLWVGASTEEMTALERGKPGCHHHQPATTKTTYNTTYL